MIVFITGGVGSGKSRFALKKAEELSKTRKKKVFIATAEPIDAEMIRKIKAHRKERKKLGWVTVEDPISPEKHIKEEGVFIVECLTTWTANLFVKIKSKREIGNRVRDFIITLRREKKKSDIVVVSNEVGLGVIPSGEETRNYIKILTYLNRKVAGIADEVFFVVSGIPLRLKPP